MKKIMVSQPMADKTLTNRDISESYRDISYTFIKSTIMGKFAEWVVRQSPYDAPDISNALNGFNEYISKIFPDSESVHTFSYDELSTFISEEEFKKVPQILELNNRKNGRDGMVFCDRYSKPHPDDDFIDLGALARNIFYSLCREKIVEG